MKFELSSNRRRIMVFSAILLLTITGICTDLFEHWPDSSQIDDHDSVESAPKISASPRKLLNHATEKKQEKDSVKPERIWGDKCSKSDIVINQGATQSLPNGIPTYTVEIMNTCASGCDISGIHLNCGWFSSARLIDPHVFKRLSFDNCLVNEGKPLSIGRTLSFQYANTFPYPLSVSSVTCS